MMQIANNITAKKWLIIIFCAFLGGILGFSFTYLLPPMRVESAAIIKLGQDQDQHQHRAAYEMMLTLPKCTGIDIQTNDVVMTQTVLPVKATPGYVSLSVTGENLAAVEKCLKDSLDFILESINAVIKSQINTLENEIVAIEQILHLNNKEGKTSENGNFSYILYPQELFLRKHAIIREIANLKNKSWALMSVSTSQISLFNLVMLRVIGSIFIGALLGALIVVYLNKPFGIIMIRRN